MLDQVYEESSKQSADLLINKREARVVSDIPEEKIREIVVKVISANTAIVESIKAGKTQAIGALIGQVKRDLPNVDISIAQELINDLL